MKAEIFDQLEIGDQVYYLLSNDWPRAKITSTRRDQFGKMIDVGVSFYHMGRFETFIVD